MCPSVIMMGLMKYVKIIIKLEMCVDMHVSHKPALDYRRLRDSPQYHNWYIDIVSIHAVYDMMEQNVVNRLIIDFDELNELALSLTGNTLKKLSYMKFLKNCYVACRIT